MSSGRFASAGEFRLSLERFKSLTKDQFVLAHKAVTLDTLSALQLGNPVRTSRSRSGWVASAGSPSPWLPPDLWDGTEAGLERARAAYGAIAEKNTAQAQLLRIEFGGASFVVSNVEYIGHVNDRHPRRAGFVEAALENVTTKYQLGGAP